MTLDEKIIAIAELFDLPGDAVNLTIKVDHERGKVRVAYDLLMDESEDLRAPMRLSMAAPDPRDRAGSVAHKGAVA